MARRTVSPTSWWPAARPGWYISGAPDPRWSDNDLSTIHQVTGDNFDVVQLGQIITG